MTKQTKTKTKKSAFVINFAVERRLRINVADDEAPGIARASSTAIADLLDVVGDDEEDDSDEGREMPNDDDEAVPVVLGSGTALATVGGARGLRRVCIDILLFSRFHFVLFVDFRVCIDILLFFCFHFVLSLVFGLILNNIIAKNKTKNKNMIATNC